MDIDIARLENTKDLLALGGEVNGIAIQCLADTCANASFIQRAAAEELGLVINKSITHTSPEPQEQMNTSIEKLG
ncbi:unnamed protein product [Rhizophagus irregularis]|nr:unnamed protein product [Rhizophagus irregularis]